MTTLSYRFGDAEVRPAQRALLVGGRDSRLGARAFDLLLALIERRERTVAKNELLDLVWPGVVVEENNLQVHVSSLRKLLGARAIATVPGRGYRFTAPVDGTAAAPVEPARAPDDVPPAPAGNVPAQCPVLYGRDADLLALRGLVEAERLVSVVGAGGIGKTALAQTLAHALREGFADGVWRVDLAPLAEPALVPTSVAGVLGHAVDGDDQRAALVRSLALRRMLIVLDNCEHLLQPVAELADALLLGAPGVRLLVTSQEPLRLTAERVHRLEALDLPAAPGLASARASGAVALFEARSRAADPRFVLDEDNVGAVVDVCRRLDGIALAIELAAARVPLLGVAGLRARLDERFRVLTGGARLALRRHQTLRAALEWSHGLLSDDERAVFRRLGVCVGSVGLEAAQRIGGDARIDSWEALEHLGALIDKSLVVADPGAEPRYRLLETTRAFALEKLQQAGEGDAALRAHAEATLAVFEASIRDGRILGRQAHLDRYLPDLDNARAALDWSAAADPALHVALAGAIAWLWGEIGLCSEARRRTRPAIALVDATTPAAHEARLKARWSNIAHPMAGPQEMAAAARAVELYRTLDDPPALFDALCRQVKAQAHRGDLELAERGLQEAERMVDAAWPPALRTILLHARMWLRCRQGRHEESMAASEEMLRVATALCDGRMALDALINLEQSTATLGRHDEAVQRGHEMLRIMQAHPALRAGIEGVVLLNLVLALAQCGRFDEALSMARRVRPLAEQEDHVRDLLEPAALIVLGQGRGDDAARIAGCAERSLADITREVVEQQLHDRLAAELRRALPPGRLAALMEQGAALGADEALRLALGE